MCGSIKADWTAEKSPISLGEYISRDIPVVVKTSPSSGVIPTNSVWEGFARKETLQEKWLSRGWEKAEVIAAAYTEKGREYQVFPGECISAVAKPSFDDRGEFMSIRIVTREAVGKERRVYSRHPEIRDRKLTPRG
jgi:hypothetical protein